MPILKKLLGFLFTLLFITPTSAQSPSWKYIAIDSTKQKWGDWDEPEWLRYFGLDFGDVDRDGCLDVVSGRYVYHNPCTDMESPWKRTVLDDNVDAIFFTDVDGDPLADIIAQALPDVYWYEATDQTGRYYTRRRVAQVPATSHVNSQGFEKAQLLPGGPDELLIAGSGDIYCITVPNNPDEADLWPTHLIGKNTSDEGIGTGDIDGDGDLDIAAGRRPPGEEEPTILVWFENPGHFDSPWQDHPVGQSVHPIDRVAVADLNNDGQAEIIMTEERYPGLEPDAHLYWFSYTSSPQAQWQRHTVVEQYSMNNLDLADLDHDGDLDIITNEHKGPSLELQVWENDGQARFTKKAIDQGKENHLGTQLVDLDGDGDLDIVGAAWDHYQWMHLWRNDEIAPSKSGSLYKEYPWAPSQLDSNELFLRVGGRLDYTLKSDNNDKIDKQGFITFPKSIDLSQAARAELIVERVQSHEDTKNMRIQVNNSPWLPVPDPARILNPASDFMFHYNAAVAVPLDYLSEQVRFRIKVDTTQRWQWPQNLVYGLVLRVYYQPEKASPEVSLTGLNPYDTLREEVTLGISPTEEVAQVDFIGLYEDVNWQGDGVYRQWQYDYHQGQLTHHLGSTSKAPFQITWNTAWVPDQRDSLQVMARVHFQDGLIYHTAPVVGLQLDREHRVELIKPYQQSANWATREGVKGEKIQVSHKFNQEAEARLYWKSWSPCYSHGLTVNGHSLPSPDNLPCYQYYEHEQKIDSIAFFQTGENTIATQKTPLYDGKMVHGMEVQWPGIMLKVKSPATRSIIGIQTGEYEGAEHFIVHTPSATYYYDQQGGGFSRIIDRNGHDWISFQREPWNEYPASASSSYRGLPNLVFDAPDGGAGHPGFEQCKSELVGDNIIKTTTHSGKWAWRWTFYDDYALLTVEKVDPKHPYWFLYEGTPGGRYEPSASYWGSDQGGPIPSVPDFYQGKAQWGKYRWLYAGHQSSDQTLFMGQRTQDSHMDLVSYLGSTASGAPSKEGMTVFGFGRNTDTTPLLQEPQEFVIGFYPHQITNQADHQQMEQYVSPLLTNY